MSGLMDVALSGLRTHQTALETTGNNISNVNTPGYSREKVDIVQSPSQLSGQGYQGTGSNVADITRVTNEFVTAQVRSDTSIFQQKDVLLNQAEQIDNLLANQTTGLTTAMDTFFFWFAGCFR
jgi:flagellar hook-associated protein 1 FlgK